MDAVEGIATSVGGLSLHVVRTAQAALLDVFRAEQHVATDHAAACGAVRDVRATISTLETTEELRNKLGALFYTCLKVQYANERLVIPVLVTIDKLLDAGVYATSLQQPTVELLSQAVKVWSKDIQKSLAIVPVLGTFAHSAVGVVRRLAWREFLGLIASRFPKVRATAAMEFYTQLTTYTATVEMNVGGGSVAAVVDAAAAVSVPGADAADLDAAQALLLETRWDDTSAPYVRSARDKLYPLLGLSSKTAAPLSGGGTATSSEASGAAKAPRFADAGYGGLVHEAGY